MTNKEKAYEIRKKSLPNPLMDGYGMWLTAGDVDYILIQMAEWKDQQFNMIIEKTIELFDKYPSNAVFSKNNVVEMFKTLKKAMEE